ncbi:MAG: transcriptional regulator GcvA [Alphaproteobacteria bacterium]|nr:transcriptional regulator GcvA [Alphaproteobacteria bacterium]
MRRLPPLNALRAFEAAARHLSFTKEAGELHVTQAAISHQIRALEEWLGLRLFKRQNRALLLTDAGQSYLPPLRDALDTIHDATATLQKRDDHAGLTVSTFTSFAAKWLLPRLGRFASAHPDIGVRLAIDDHIVEFRSDNAVDYSGDGVDVGIRYGRGNWKGVHMDRLMTEVVFVVCSPKLLSGEHPLRTPRDLAYQTLLHDDLPENWSTWLEAAGVEVKARRDLVFNHSEMVLQAAIGGLGVALGRSVLVADDLAAGRLISPFELQLPAQSAYYFVCPDGAQDRPKIKAFRDWILEEVARDAQHNEGRDQWWDAPPAGLIASDSDNPRSVAE